MKTFTKIIKTYITFAHLITAVLYWTKGYKASNENDMEEAKTYYVYSLLSSGISLFFSCILKWNIKDLWLSERN